MARVRPPAIASTAAAVVAAVVAAGTAACGNDTGSPSSGSSPAAATMSAQPTGSPTATGRLSAQDKKWMTMIHQVNLAEIEVGRLAQRKGTTAQVRSLGRTFVDDHTMLDRKVVSVSRSLNITLPSGVMPDQAELARKLAQMSGRQFNDTFVSTSITGHQDAIAATKTEISRGSNPMVISVARQALPVLQKHLTMSKKAVHG